jgi:hypothetical protein
MQPRSMLPAWRLSVQVALLPTPAVALGRSGQDTERAVEAGRDGGWEEGDTEKWQGIAVDVAVMLTRQ